MRPGLRSVMRELLHVAAFALAALALAFLLVTLSSAEVRAGTSSSVPAQAQRYRAELIRNARAIWGLEAPVATFAAQIHQESGWREDAKSPVGARGLAQFMPATAQWISGVYTYLGTDAPYSPSWSIRALITYDKYLFERVKAASEFEAMAMALSSYNGGLGWVYRDQKLAASQGLDSQRWWDSVETVNAGRGQAAFAENRGYPRRILLKLEQLYVESGWGRGVRND